MKNFTDSVATAGADTNRLLLLRCDFRSTRPEQQRGKDFCYELFTTLIPVEKDNLCGPLQSRSRQLLGRLIANDSLAL